LSKGFGLASMPWYIFELEPVRLFWPRRTARQDRVFLGLAQTFMLSYKKIDSTSHSSVQCTRIQVFHTRETLNARIQSRERFADINFRNRFRLCWTLKNRFRSRISSSIWEIELYICWFTKAIQAQNSSWNSEMIHSDEDFSRVSESHGISLCIPNIQAIVLMTRNFTMRIELLKLVSFSIIYCQQYFNSVSFVLCPSDNREWLRDNKIMVN
jgi:hypothetical protein